MRKHTRGCKAAGVYQTYLQNCHQLFVRCGPVPAPEAFSQGVVGTSRAAVVEASGSTAETRPPSGTPAEATRNRCKSSPSSAALRELRAALPRNLVIRRCPRLHFKVVVIDSRRMYLGSANLTGAGLGAKGEGKRNFELGVWTESAALIDAVVDQFNALWEGHRCVGCRRKDVCPVPLEEPSLGNG